MNKALKWFIILGGGLVLLVIAVLIAIPFFVDINQYKPEIEKRVAAATGRSFSIGSDLDLSLFPFAGIQFSDLRLGSPTPFAEKEFATIDGFEVRVKLMPLLSKEIEVKRFVMKRPRIVLVKNKNGAVNWDFSAGHEKKAAHRDKKEPSKGKTEALPIKRLNVQEFSITDGSLAYIDHAGGTRKEIKGFNLELTDVSLDKPVQVKLSATLDEKPLSLEGKIGPIGREPGKGTVSMDLAVRALKELAVTAKGSVKDPAVRPAYDLKITISDFSPRKLVAAMGGEFPVATPDPKALDRASLAFGVTGDLSHVALTDGTLVLDDSKLAFSAKAKDFLKPDVAFNLNLDAIDLDRYLPKPAEKTDKTGAPPPAAAKTKPDYRPLRRLVLDGALRIGQLKVNNAKLQDVELKVAGKNGIFNLQPLALKLYQGEVTLSGVLNVQKDAPATRLELLAKTIQAGPLLKDLIQKDILQGAAFATAALQFTGDDPQAVKKTLNGKGELRFEDGAIVGVDIPGMVRNVQAAFGAAEATGGQRPKTDFSELNVPFTLKDGLFHTAESSLKSPLIRLLAAGKADLVNETLDFRVEPKVVGTIKGQGDTEQRSGVMVPVLVSGTFAAPKFRPDLKGIAEGQLKEKVLQSEEAKKILEKPEVKKFEEPAKGLLKGIMGQ